MPILTQYLLKLFISLAVVWLFYHFILRKLTFYNHNRWYLLGYSLLSFFIPLVNIAPALQKNELSANTVIQWIPVVYRPSAAVSAGTVFTAWNILATIIVSGMLFMLVRLLVQLVSFRRMMKKASLIASGEVKVYQVDADVIPFSFGNAVFINPALHNSEELQEIIRHEFVHVKQRHSFDILFSEFLCLLNWYNPFAWMIRLSIRQNLEFIADHKVLEKGTNKKQYQYLLLKVIGNNQFSIAPKFNFSSLKKRIAMMNKLQSSKKHLLRFLFLLPVLAFVLVSFRKEIGDTLSGRQRTGMPPVFTDTVPHPSTLNDKGYQITIRDNKGNCTVVIRDRDGKEVKQMPLTIWDKNATLYEARYGEIPPAPPSPKEVPAPPGGAPMKDFLERNPSVKEVGWVYNRDNSVAILHLNMKDGTTQQYDLRDEAQRKTAEAWYGQIPLLTIPDGVEEQPVPPAAPGTPSIAITIPDNPLPPPVPDVVELPANVTSVEVNNDKITVKLKNGKTETYDKNNAADMKMFQAKYGDILPKVPAPPPRSSKEPGRSSIEITPFTTVPDNIVYILDGRKIAAAEMKALPPNDIASITILKNESATSLYGKEAAAGVILITSKGAKPATNLSLQEVVVEGKQKPNSSSLQEVVVEGKRKAVNVALEPVVVEGKPTNLQLANPVTEAAVVEKVKVASTSPARARTDVNLVQEESATRVLEIAGLGLKDEDQYILVDGKEYKPRPGDKLKGRYRITFIDRKEALKQYGEKARNGAILVESQK